MHQQDRVHGFVSTIWDWYAQNKRLLPWRDLSDTNPVDRAYKVLVSEIMLQQTQVSRVKIVFKDFLERFPFVHDLAQASNREILMAWRGMGYNSRALRLRDAAKVIAIRLQIADCKQEKGNLQSAICNSSSFPQSMEELLSIPGIGHYTAAAIRNFAFNIPTPCLDTNIRRILHRTFVGPENPDGAWRKDDAYLLELAGKILKVAVVHEKNCKLQIAKDLQYAICNCPHSSANWHAALMDFGSLVQTKNNPRWDECPLTAKGLMKATPAQWKKIPKAKSQKPNSLKEPGRFVGARYIPNRIFRGKVIEELRDAAAGLPLETIGKRMCIDWSPKAHEVWLQGILKKLVTEKMIVASGRRYRLYE